MNTRDQHTRFTIHGKHREIRDVRDVSETTFEAYYYNHFIYVFRDDRGKWYAQCSAPDGGRIVDGFVSSSKRGSIKVCLENIFHREIEPPATLSPQTT